MYNAHDHAGSWGPPWQTRVDQVEGRRRARLWALKNPETDVKSCRFMRGPPCTVQRLGRPGQSKASEGQGWRGRTPKLPGAAPPIPPFVVLSPLVLCSSTGKKGPKWLTGTHVWILHYAKAQSRNREGQLFCAKVQHLLVLSFCVGLWHQLGASNKQKRNPSACDCSATYNWLGNTERR